MSNMGLGPEFATLFTEFDHLYLFELNYRHHEEGISTQKSFEKQVTSLIQVTENYGNPFMDACLLLQVHQTL